MKSLTLLFLILLAPRAWAKGRPHTLEYKMTLEDWQEQFSTPALLGVEEIILHGSAPSIGWRIIRGTQSYTLYQFISSGRLCDFRGHHEWSNDVGNLSESPCGTWSDGQVTIYDPGQMCVICHKCRQKVKVTKDGEVFEP